VSTTEAEPGDFDWTVRAAVYRGFAESRAPPSVAALAGALEVEPRDVQGSLRRLEAGHHLTLLPDGSGVWMAHPFSALPTAYAVDTPRGRYWANCAWDALGVPAILGLDGQIEARCALSGEPLGFGVRDGRRVGDAGIVHLVVPPRDAWRDIGFT
jgi:hypothetical protein